MSDPLRSISDRLNHSVDDIAGLEAQYNDVLQVTEKALDKLAEIVRGMDELDMLGESIQKSRERITRLTADLRGELGSGFYHMKETSEVLASIKDEMADDATLLTQKLAILAQSNPSLVKTVLENTTEFSRGVALSHLEIELLLDMRNTIDNTIEAHQNKDIE